MSERRASDRLRVAVIGVGHFGLEGFETIMGHSAFRDVPFLLEVPGFDNKGPDKQNMGILRDLRVRAGLSS